jgi:hypothetical protein
MSNTNIIGAISCSNATAYTGSFVKLQALGNSDEEVTITEVQWGQLKTPYSANDWGTGTGPLELVAGGAPIEGPIFAFKTGTNTVTTGILAYYKKI